MAFAAHALTPRSGELGDNRRQPLRDNLLALWQVIETLRADNGTLRADINTLRTDVNARALQTALTALTARVVTLETGSYPITFVFGGVPAVNSHINVPLTMNLSITTANLAASRYYNAVNASSASMFRLRVMPAGTIIGTCSVSAAGVGSFSGTGSTTLSNANTLRMTAETVGQDLTDVAISIQTTRRA